MDNNGYYTGKHSSFMLPPVNYQIQYDNFSDYPTSSQVQQQQQQQHQQQLPHQVQTTHQPHHDIQSTISVKLDTINKSPSQKNDEIQACSGGYTGNNSSNDFHGNLYHYNKNLDNSDGIAAYNQTSVVSNYSDFDHIGGSSIGQKSLSSFLLPQSHQQQQQHQQPHTQQHQQQNPQIQQPHQPHSQHPPTAAIIPQSVIGNVHNDASNQQSKVLGTFDQRTASKCYSSKAATTATLHGYQQPGYKESEMPFNFNKLPPIPQTYHHVYPTYDKYSIQPRATTHHKPYDDNPTNSRPYVCQTMPMTTNHKPTSQPELFCSSSATTEQHNRFSNRNFLFPNSAFTTPTNGYFAPMYHRSNNVHRNLSLPPPLQPAIDDSSNYYHNNSLLVRGGSYNRSQMAFQQAHYPYARSSIHPMPIPKLQSKSDIDIMSGLAEDIYHRPYNVSYEHYDEYQFPQVPPSTHYPTKSSKVIYAPYSSNPMNAYPPSTTHQQSTAQHQQHQPQQQQQQQQQQQHHQSVIQNQVLSSNDYSRYACSNVQPSSANCSNKVYLQDQYAYANHPQMIYSHGTSEVAQTELPKYNQSYDKHTTAPADKLAFVDLEEQITGSKILKTRELAPSSSYDCSKSNYNKEQYFYNYNGYQQLRGSAEQEASKNQSIRDYLSTWNDDEEEDGEVNSGKKTNTRRIAAIDVMSRSCGQSKLEMESGGGGASNVPTTKINFAIKVDSGGIQTKNLPDIINDIEKPKVVVSDESYSSVADKLYVLESIDVPFSDLNKYKHLSVVNKLPDNIVQIDRRKGDSLDDVEETLKLIEKCEERVRMHKSGFELNVKFEEDDARASPIRSDCISDIRLEEEDNMLDDPLRIHEMPIDADQHTVPAPSPTIEQDEENTSNAHHKTADDGQEEDDNINHDDDEEEEVETMKDGDGEVVRYKCVQKNGNELIHSDVAIPKLKIKIMRRKRTKSFRSRKIKNSSDSFDAHDEIKLMQTDETVSDVKTLKILCLDVVNTNSFRKYLISLRENESQNVFQYSGQTSIENNAECGDSLKSVDGEFVEESVDVANVPSDLIEIKNVNHSLVASDNESELPSNVSNANSVEETAGNASHVEPESTFDNGDPSNDQNPSSYDCFPQRDTELDNSVDNHSLGKYDFHTPSVGDDFADPHLDVNFASIRNINHGDDLPTVPFENNDTTEEINSFFPLNDAQTFEAVPVNVVDNNDTNTNPNDQNIERSDKCIESIMDIQSVASLIEHLDEAQSVPSSCVEDSELIKSFDAFEELIGSSDGRVASENSSATTTPHSSEAEVSEPTESKDQLNALESMTRVFKTEPMKSDYTDSSSSSCSSSDYSSDSDFPSETIISPTKQQDDSASVTNTDDNNGRVSNTSCSSSDESEYLDEKSREGSSERKVNPSDASVDSGTLYTKSSSNESDVNELKVKIENEEIPVHSKSNDRTSHSSDNEFKSSSYSGSSSDNSDDSSSESDDEIVSDTVPKIEKNLPEVDSLFVVRKIKTEEAHPYSDTTDESSIGSFDETESETAIKDISTRDNKSVKSNSSSDTSDDEYVEQSPVKSILTENGTEKSKTGSDTELSDEEEEDKKSCSSNSSSMLSATEKHDSLSDSVTGSETCTDSTATPISIARKNSSTNSDEKYAQESITMANYTEQVTEDLIKTEPINDDTHLFNSSSDNSDDEYVKLSPLNSNALDECSGTNNLARKLSQLSNQNVATNGTKKPILSSDSYSSSSSSSSSSRSSSSDEYSSDEDDDVFERKPPLKVLEVDKNVKIDSTESEPIKTIKTEEGDPSEQDVQIDREEIENNVEQHLSQVEEEVIHNREKEVNVDALCNDHEKSEKIVEAVNQNVEYVKDTLPAAENVDCNSDEEHHNSCNLLPNGTSVDEESESIESSERIDSDSKKFDENAINCGANEVEAIISFPAIVATESGDFREPRADSTEADSCQTTFEQSNDRITPDDCNVPDEVNLNTLIGSYNLGPAESVNEKQIDLQNFANSIDEKCENRESSNATDASKTSASIDADDSGVSLEESLQSFEPIVTATEIISPAENDSIAESESEVSDEIAVVQRNETETTTVDDPEDLIDKSEIAESHSTAVETGNAVESSHQDVEKEASDVTVATCSNENDSSETEIISDIVESTNQNPTEDGNLHAVQIVNDSPTAPKDLIYPVLDIPVKLIPLPGETFNEALYQKLINNGEIFPTRKTDEIYDFDDFYSKIPVALIPLPGETIDENATQFVEFKRKYFENRKNVILSNGGEEIVRNQEDTELVSQSEAHSRSPISAEFVNKATLVICESVPSLKVLCEKVLGVAGLHYEEDDEIATSINGDDEMYLYILNDNDDFWSCSDQPSSPLLVCYDGELDDDVFVESDFSAPIESSSVHLANVSEKSSITSQVDSVDSFTIDSHDIQYEEIVPVNRTMYKLETFKRYLQSKYIQKPNYIHIHCIKKILRKYSNYQRYRKHHAQATVQKKCKERMENFKNLLNHPKNNETSPLASNRYTVSGNGLVTENDVLRSNCDINKSKLLLLTNNNVKSKRNLNSTHRSHKSTKECAKVSTISSYVSEMTKSNHLKESRAFAKEIITNKRSIKSNAKVPATPIVDKSKVLSQSHSSPTNQIAISKRKISESIVESMITRNNKKRKLSFDDTLLGINRFYKQSSVDCDRIDAKPSGSGNKLKERSNVYSINSNILNNSKDKVRRLIIPKSKIFDGPNVSTKNKFDPLVDVPYVKLVRNPYIDNLSKSYVKSTATKSLCRK